MNISPKEIGKRSIKISNQNHEIQLNATRMTKMTMMTMMIITMMVMTVVKAVGKLTVLHYSC